MYFPETGTFSGPDLEIKLAGNGVTNYGMGNSNPLSNTDPEGLDWYARDGKRLWREGNEELEGFERIGPKLEIPLVLTLNPDKYKIRSDGLANKKVFEGFMSASLEVTTSGRDKRGRKDFAVAVMLRRPTDPASIAAWNDFMNKHGYAKRHSRRREGQRFEYADLLQQLGSEQPRFARLQNKAYVAAIASGAAQVKAEGGWHAGKVYTGVWTSNWQAFGVKDYSFHNSEVNDLLAPDLNVEANAGSSGNLALWVFYSTVQYHYARPYGEIALAWKVDQEDSLTLELLYARHDRPIPLPIALEHATNWTAPVDAGIYGPRVQGKGRVRSAIWG